MFGFTARLAADVAARRSPGLGLRTLLRSLASRPHSVERFLGVRAGVEPVERFLTPGNVARLLLGHRSRRGPGPQGRISE